MKLSFSERFFHNFIADDRWRYIASGLVNTIIIAQFAVCIGVILGAVIAFIRTSDLKTGKLKIPNLLCRLYLTVIRGTPALI